MTHLLALLRRVSLGACPPVLAALALASCGGSDEGQVAVELVAFDVDGAAPSQGWRLVGEGGREAALAPSGARGALGAIFRAALPDGKYALRGSGEWGPMSGSVPVAFVAGRTPPQIAVGRRHSLYLIPPPGLRVVQARVLPVGSRDPGQPAPATDVEAGADGRAVVRFRGGVGWGGTVQVLARLDPPAFAEPDRVALPGDGTPWGTGVRAGPLRPLDVTLVGASAPPGRAQALAWDVRDAEDLDPVRLEAPLDGAGRARFERFPLARAGATLETPGGAASLDPGDLVRGDVRLRALAPPGRGAKGVIALPADAARVPPRGAVRLQLRAEDDDSYGLVEARPDPDDAPGAWVLERALPPGRWRALLLAEDQAYASPDPVPVAEGDAPARFLLAGGAACRAQVSIGPGIAPGRRPAVLVRRIEGSRAVLAHGFVLRDLARADLDVVLPTGRYRFAVELDGREGPPVEMEFTRPGTRAVVRVQPPR